MCPSLTSKRDSQWGCIICLILKLGQNIGHHTLTNKKSRSNGELRFRREKKWEYSSFWPQNNWGPMLSLEQKSHKISQMQSRPLPSVGTIIKALKDSRIYNLDSASFWEKIFQRPRYTCLIHTDILASPKRSPELWMAHLYWSVTVNWWSESNKIKA